MIDSLSLHPSHSLDVTSKLKTTEENENFNFNI